MPRCLGRYKPLAVAASVAALAATFVVADTDAPGTDYFRVFSH